MDHTIVRYLTHRWPARNRRVGRAEQVPPQRTAETDGGRLRSARRHPDRLLVYSDRRKHWAMPSRCRYTGTLRCPRGFAATHWTAVLAAARGKESSRAAEAMTELCRTYWYPLYAFLRRRGHEPHEAEDLTQEFFAAAAGTALPGRGDRRKGKFRSFLLAALKHFLSDQRDRAQAQKRGGGRVVLSLDSLDAETRYRLEPAQDLTPEKMFEKQWALSVLERVLSRLQAELVGRGQSGALRGPEGHARPAAAATAMRRSAAELGMTRRGGQGGRPPPPPPLSGPHAGGNRPDGGQSRRSRGRDPLPLVVLVVILFPLPPWMG